MVIIIARDYEKDAYETMLAVISVVLVVMRIGSSRRAYSKAVRPRPPTLEAVAYAVRSKTRPSVSLRVTIGLIEPAPLLNKLYQLVRHEQRAA